MKLYLLTGDLEDGENLDQIVSAETPAQALELWHDGYEEFLGTTQYLTLLEGVDLDYQNPGYDEVIRVFEIIPTGLPGCLGWRSAHGHTGGPADSAGVTILVGHAFP